MFSTGLNRYFNLARNIDIVSDKCFMRCNLVFEGVQVKGKEEGRGVVHSTPHIADTDLIKIGMYFDVGHMKEPKPYILQHTVQFYLMYFFCRRGQENLYDLTKDHFKVIAEPEGTQYVIQMANQGKMYADPSEYNHFARLILLKN